MDRIGKNDPGKSVKGVGDTIREASDVPKAEKEGEKEGEKE